MSHYVTLGALDVDIAKDFYDATLATIGWSSHERYAAMHAYSQGGTGEGLVVWLCEPFDERTASPGNGTMIGFAAPTREAVDAFHATGLAHGGTSEGAPGLRPHYDLNWYAAYIRDPTGNKLAAVCRT